MLISLCHKIAIHVAQHGSLQAPLVQGMHDWGLWFATLLIMGLVTLVVVLVMVLIRRPWQ
jgi:hypothetical protein